MNLILKVNSDAQQINPIFVLRSSIAIRQLHFCQILLNWSSITLLSWKS